jgi:hypothetical protein
MTTDLRNVFDAFLEADRRMGEIAAKQRELARLVKNARKRCGNCDKWMKSRECPREHNVMGMTRGPSCEDMPCGQFVSSPSHVKNLAELAAHEAKP